MISLGHLKIMLSQLLNNHFNLLRGSWNVESSGSYYAAGFLLLDMYIYYTLSLYSADKLDYLK